MNICRSWNYLAIILLMQNINIYMSLPGRCVQTSLPHLLPANMPPEIKQFIFRQKTSEISDFINFFIQLIVVDKFHYLVQYFYKLHINVKNLNNALHRTVKVSSLERHRDVLNYDGIKVYNKLGKVFMLQIPTRNVKFRQERIAFYYKFSVPFDQNLNITFFPVERRDSCPFILCFEKIRAQSLKKTCTLVKGLFPPWSIILKEQKYPTGNLIYFRIYVALLYNENMFCSENLLKMTTQPTISKIQSYAYGESETGFNPYGQSQTRFDQQRSRKCSFKKILPLMKFYPNPKMKNSFVTVSYVKILRILVPPNQHISVTLHQYNYFKYCETETKKLYMYNGPGVLSQKMDYKIIKKRVTYIAFSYQVFVLHIGDLDMRESCFLRYNARNSIKKSVKIQNHTASYHWRSNSALNASQCTESSQITFCRLKVKEEQNLLFNMTLLRGSTCMSYSENTHSKVGLCHYGLLSVNYFSSYGKSQQYFVSNFCAEQVKQGQEIWLSTKGKLDIAFYSYYPYSDLEIKFHVSPLKCESITIVLCTVNHGTKIASYFWNNVSISEHSRTLQENMNTYTIKLRNDNICVLVNMFRGFKGFCVSYNLEILSEVGGEVGVIGYIQLDFFIVDYYDRKLHFKTFVQHTYSKGKIPFYDGKHQSFNISGQKSYVCLNVGPAVQTKLLSFISAIKVYTIARASNKQTGNAVLKSQYISDLSLDSTLKCYKLVLHSVDKNTSIQFHTMYSRYTYAANFPQRTRKKLCRVRIPYDNELRPDKSFTCDDSIFEATQNTLPRPNSATSQIRYNEIFNLNMCLRRKIKIGSKPISIYISNDVTLQSKTDGYQVYKFSYHSSQSIRYGNVTKIGGALIQLNDVSSMGHIVKMLELQKPGTCYDKAVNTLELIATDNKAVVLHGTANFKKHKYQMHFLLGQKWKILPSCLSLMTCSYLDRYETSLVSWNYANQYCRKQNMTLLTIGSKEEELHAMSLQTSFGEDGRRYDMQLVYLGLFSEESGAYKWVDNTPLSYFQWNEFHHSKSIDVSYDTECNSYEHENYMGKVIDMVKNNYPQRKVLNSVISQELSKKQPSTKADYNCTASYLGDMRHSDWIKVPCDTPLTSSWICESQVNNKSLMSMDLQHDVFCRSSELAFEQFCLMLLPFRENIAHILPGFISIQKITKYLHSIFKNHKDKIIVSDGVKNIEIYNNTENENNTSKQVMKYFLYINNGIIERLSFSCSSGFFICNNSSQQCIAPQFICDKDADCPGGEDEESCDCSDSMLLSINCIASNNTHFVDTAELHQNTARNFDGKLIPSENLYKYMSFKSNTSRNKMQSEEKLLCNIREFHAFNFLERCLFNRNDYGLPSTCPFGLHLKECATMRCTNSFKCPKSYCVPYRNICDGKWDCPDGDDEHMKCSEITCPGFFHCKGLLTCLHPSEICDGKIDCRTKYMDDEIMCIQNYFCPTECKCLGSGLQCKKLGLITLPLSHKIKVEYLLLSFCNYTTIAQYQFSSFVSLKHLNLSHNQISDIAIDAFSSNMLYLNTLDLKSNKLKVLLKHQFVKLISAPIKYLFIIVNNLHEIHECAFAGMKYLVKLNLCCMSIYLLKKYSFANITKLSNLNLSNNNINYLNVHIFSNSPSISILDISNNKITFLSPYAYQYLATLDKIVTSHSGLCCMLSKHLTHCVSKAKDEGYACSVQWKIFAVLLRIFLSLCLSTNFSALAFYSKSNLSVRVNVIPQFIDITYAVNVLLIDLNNTFTLQVEERFVRSRIILCNFTKIFSTVLFQMVLLSPILNSINAFIFSYYPFRRKGLSTNLTMLIYSSGILLLLLWSLISVLLDASDSFSTSKSVTYRICIRLLTDSLFQKYSAQLLINSGFFILMLFKSLVVYKLLIKKTLANQQGEVITKFGIHIVFEALIFSLLWVPIVAIMALPYSAERENTMTNVLLILSLMIIISCNVLFIFTKEDFRNFISCKHKAIRKKSGN